MSSVGQTQSFGTVFLGIYMKSALSWVQTVGCLWAIYGYLVSNKRKLWTILLVHAISGLLGIFVEAIYWTKVIRDPADNVPILLGLNEINWILHESTVVIYSLVKLQPVISNPRVKKFIQISMSILFLCYSGFRVMIGYLRVRDQVGESPEIANAHSFAFIFWGLADAIIFILLIKFTIDHLRKGNEQFSSLILTLFKSSIPRLLVLVLNTTVIVALGQIPLRDITQNDIYTLVWAIKGTYPIILLFDLMSTKAMLLLVTSKSSGSNSFANKSSKV
jgi:hypothetical protein